MARRLIAVEEMSSESCTFSVGVIESGKWVNCVPSWCRAEALSMAKRQADLDQGVERMLALSGVEHDVGFDGDARRYPPRLGAERGHAGDVRDGAPLAGHGPRAWPRQRRRRLGRQFHRRQRHPTLDGLGAEGKDYHTLEERIEVDGLSRRGRLMAGLLATLGA
jgi:glutamate carboxypeptidase